MASLSSSLSSLHSLNVSIAIQYGDENRRMWFPNTMPWSEVRSSILSCYLLTGNDYRFSYLDEEGDAIAIDQDNEYIEAKRSAASKGSHLQLSLVKIAQNGAADERSKDDFVGLEDNSDLEESYVSVNALSKPSPVAAPQEKKADDAAASDEDDDDDNIDDALTALQEAEQQQEQQIKMPVNEDAKESPPLPTPPPAMVQDSNVSPANNVDVVNEPKKSASMNAALVAISSVLGTGAAQEGLAKTVASSLINYCVSIASPTDAELIRSNQSLLEERVNDGVKGRINNALLARLLVRRLFIAKKKKIARSKKSPKSKPSNEDAQQKSPTISVASSSSSSSSGSGRAIHHNVRCDECNNGPIVGARYHCITCDENDEIRQRGGWDCCEVCETKTNHCSSGAVRHVLIKMKTPAKIVVEKEQPSPQLIASGHPLIYDAFAHFGDESKAVPLGVVRGSAAEEKDAKKKQKKGGKKYAKQLIQMLLQQFSDESFSCSDDSSSDDENAQRKLMKKMEKQKKKAEKAMKKAEKLKLKAEKKAEKTAEKSAVKVNDEKKEEESEKNEEVNKNEEKKEEVKEEPKEKQENEQPSNPSPVSENQSLQVESAAAAATSPQIIHNHEPIIKTEASSSSSSSSDSSVASSSHAADPSPKSSIIEQKAVEQPVAQPVPIPIAHPVIIPPSVPSLPAIIPAPLFPAPPSFLPPSNPFTFPAPSSPVPSPSMPSPPAPVPAPAPLVFLYSDQLQQLTAMGFPRERSMEILNYYSGDLRKALNRLL